MKKLLALLFSSIVVAFAGQAKAADLTPQFGYVAPGWFTVGAFDLSQFWQQAGFQESGISYAYIAGPGPNGGYAERFDPLGPSYECFLGAYVIKNWKYASDWLNHDGTAKHMQPSDVVNSANELIALGIIDQAVWLTAYGAPPQNTGSSLGKGPVILPDGDGFFLVTFTVNTFSDLGAPTSLYGFDPPYSVYSSVVPAFQPVTAEAFVLVKYDVPSGDFLVKYGSGTLYQLSNGQYKNTPASTIFQIGKMMAATTFQ